MLNVTAGKSHDKQKRNPKVVEKSVEKDDSLMTKEEFFDKIDRALAEYEQGKFYRCTTNEEMFAFLDSL